MGYDIDLVSDTELLIADRSNHTLRLYDTQTFVEEEVSTIAGRNSSADINSIFGTNSLRLPYGHAVDASGNVYIADLDNNKIRKLDTSTGELTTIAGPAEGSRTAGFADGIGNAARFRKPIDVAVNDAANLLYVLDRDNNCLDKLI